MEKQYVRRPAQDTELYHYGVKGMKWGVRRYRNEDGSLTEKGKKKLVKEYAKIEKRSYNSRTFNRDDTEKYEFTEQNFGGIKLTSAYKRLSDIKAKESKQYRTIQKEIDSAVAKRTGLPHRPNEFKDSESKKNYMAIYKDEKRKALIKHKTVSEKLMKEHDEAEKEYLSSARQYTEQLLGKYGNTAIKTRTATRVDDMTLIDPKVSANDLITDNVRNWLRPGDGDGGIDSYNLRWAYERLEN